MFFITELIMVPIMGRVVQSIGSVADAHPPYHDAFASGRRRPTPLWLAPLALFVPNLYFAMVVMFFALGASARTDLSGSTASLISPTKVRHRLSPDRSSPPGLVAGYR